MTTPEGYVEHGWWTGTIRTTATVKESADELTDTFQGFLDYCRRYELDPLQAIEPRVIVGPYTDYTDTNRKVGYYFEYPDITK